MKKIDSKIIVIIIGILATIFFCYPFLNQFNITGHDLEFHLTRIQQIALNITNFPVLIHSGLVNNLGYANPIFYPELFLYIPALLNKFGVGIISSYKIFIIMITFTTYIIMYITCKNISKKTSIGIIGALLYTFSLYRIVDVYTRAALGEVLAFVFAPLVLLGIYEMIYGDEKKFWILPIGIFGIVNSHIISFGLTVLFIFLFLLLNIRRIFSNKKRLKSIIISGFISILLSLSVFMPIFEQSFSNEYKVFTNGTSEELSTKSLLITQIFMNEYKNLTCKNNDVINNQMNFGNGILLLILPLFIFITKWNNSNYKEFIWKVFLSGIIIIIITSIIFPWQYFSFMNFIQLPWRFNIIITLCFSLVGAYCFYYSMNNKDNIYILSIIIILVTSAYLDKIEYTDLKENNSLYTNIGQGEYLPAKFVNYDDAYVFDIDDRNKSYEFINENGTIKFNLNNNSKNINVPLLYYKGYNAYLINDNKKEKLNVSMNNNGMILLENEDLKTGEVEVKYEMTLIQKLSYLISYGTLFSLFGYLIINKKRKEKE